MRNLFTYTFPHIRISDELLGGSNERMAVYDIKYCLAETSGGPVEMSHRSEVCVGPNWMFWSDSPESAVVCMSISWSFVELWPSR